MHGYIYSILHISTSLFKLSSCCLSQEKNMRRAPGEIQPSKIISPKTVLCVPSLPEQQEEGMGIDTLRIRRLLITELTFMFEVLSHSLCICCEQIICKLLWAGVESKKEELSLSQCQDQSTKDPFGSCNLKVQVRSLSSNLWQNKDLWILRCDFLLFSISFWQLKVALM